MPQLIPFYFVNQLIYGIIAISILISIFSIYILPRIYSIFLYRLFITKVK